MEQFKTIDYYIDCDKCKKKINYCYINNNNKLCQECFVRPNREFPKGTGNYCSCKLCKPPNIYWFYQRTYGKITED